MPKYRVELAAAFKAKVEQASCPYYVELGVLKTRLGADWLDAVFLEELCEIDEVTVDSSGALRQITLNLNASKPKFLVLRVLRPRRVIIDDRRRP